MSRIAEAAAYAARIHRGQTRTGTDAPKVAHLFGVTANVLEDAGRNGEVDEDEAVAALLHDAAEDAGGRERLEDVRRRFGDRVAELVEALSDTLDPDPPPWCWTSSRSGSSCGTSTGPRRVAARSTRSSSPPR